LIPNAQVSKDKLSSSKQVGRHEYEHELLSNDKHHNFKSSTHKSGDVCCRTY